MAIWAVVPAAGTGTRMGAELPKQYLPLLGRPILAHSLLALSAGVPLEALVLVVSPRDEHWRAAVPSLPCPLRTAQGGAVRAHSVLNGLTALAAEADAHDWVLVHDAVRPCLAADDVRRLTNAVRRHEVGGILAAPLRDTLKRCVRQGAGLVVSQTVPRAGLWQALTPQMFRFGALMSALEAVSASDEAVTDEASAIEHLGYRPLVVEGRVDNIKITNPGDLPLATAILSARQAAGR